MKKLNLLLVIMFISASQIFSQEKWKITIASENEPGEKMIVSGTVYKPDGKTPAGGIKMYVYHTDAEGYYTREGGNERHRLNGTIITNAEGRYEYHTIKPASYPKTNVNPHVHYKVTGKDYPEQWFELRFKESEEKNPFSSTQKLVKDENGILRCTFDLKLED